MNHDLAKELKAAGFPNIKDLQHRQGREFIPPNGTVRVYSLGDAADVENWFIPTLEELIAAVFALVPDKFLDLSSRSEETNCGPPQAPGALVRGARQRKPSPACGWRSRTGRESWAFGADAKCQTRTSAARVNSQISS